MCSKSLTVGAAIAALTTASPGAASAQGAGPSAPPGLAVQQFRPAPGGDLNYVSVEGAATLDHLRPAFGLLFNHAYQPLVLKNDATGQTRGILEHQTQLDLALALGLGGHLQLGLALPVTLHQTAGEDGIRELSAQAMGDLRVVPKVALLNSGKGIQLSLAGALSLPTGDAEELQGDEGPTVEPRAIVEYNFTRRLRGGLNAGYRVRKNVDFLGLPVGNELTYGAAFAFDAWPERFTLVAETYGRATADPSTRLDVDTLPLEATLGWRWQPVRGHTVTVGTGPGLSGGYGSPTWRTYLAYALTDRHDTGPGPALAAAPPPPPVAAAPAPPEPPGDRDRDGFIDHLDRCPDEPELWNGHEDGDGCPDAVPVRIVETEHVKVKDGVVEILQKVHFESDRAVIQPVSYGVLDEVAYVLRENPQIAVVRIEGHTDSSGPDLHNLTLSKERAASVRVYLVGRGVAPERLRSEGYGETRPVVANDTAENKALNRRVEFRIAGPEEVM